MKTEAEENVREDIINIVVDVTIAEITPLRERQKDMLGKLVDQTEVREGLEDLDFLMTVTRALMPGDGIILLETV